MDTETPELVEPCDELSAEWELRLAELKLMQLSIADPDEVSGGQSFNRDPGLNSRPRAGRADPC
jgi:hypothetical protein